jgi:hypothetical protein
MRRMRQVVTAGRGDHREAFEAIVELGIPREEVLGGVFGFVQSARVDQIDHAVRLWLAQPPRSGSRSGQVRRADALFRGRPEVYRSDFFGRPSVHRFRPRPCHTSLITQA